MLARIQNIVQISTAIARTEFKLRNEGSYLGILWYLLNPLLMFLLLMAVFSDKLGQGISFYQAYLLLGIIMFNFFQQATIESIRTIRDNRLIIKSINFPHASLIIAVIIKTLFSHLIEYAFFIFLLMMMKVPLMGIIFYPLILVFLCFFTAGCCFLLSSLAVYFIDLENIWLFVSRLLWIATPIFYAIEIHDQLLIMNLLNPMYYFIAIGRDAIIYATMPPSWMVLITIVFSLIILAVGLFVFRGLNRKFAELI